MQKIIQDLYYEGRDFEVIDFCKKNNLTLNPKDYDRPLVFLTTTKYLALPIASNREYGIEIDWGDGSKVTLEKLDYTNRNAIFHDYKDETLKTVRIFKRGAGIKHFGSRGGFHNLDRWSKGLVEFRTLGDIGIEDLEGAFAGLKENVPLDHLDTSNITNMACCFIRSNWNRRLDNWKVSNVEDLSFMFMDSTFNNDSIDDWNVSKVKSGRQTFFNCMRVRNPNIDCSLPNWKVDKNVKKDMYAPTYEGWK